jgi:Tfp pilus assembly protein PilO
MKWLPTLRPRERRLALIAAVMIGSWGLVSWAVQPLWDRTRDLGSHVGAQQEKLAALTRLFGQRSSIERDYQALAPYLAMEKEGQLPGAFLNELEALSRLSNLQVNFKPRPVKQEEHLSRFEVELDLEGAQAQLMAFLDSLFTIPKFVAIERLRISSIPTKEDLLRANLVIQRLVIK